MRKTKYLDKDLYDNHGKLLLSAGHRLSDSMLRKLELLDYTEEEPIVPQNNSSKSAIKSSTNKIKSVFKIKSVDLIDSASEIVTDIIFNSKNMPWWLYVNALSNHVDWLYTHSINVSIISSMLAKVLNLTTELKDIALGAFIHDIGNLMLPKSILQKKTELTDEETSYMRQHCDLGFSIVAGNNLSQTCLDIILQHHELLDGSGYPLGLRGEQIPQHSRIVMIANIVDAITSYRPFTSARRIESAIKELKNDPGKYPQDIIDLFSSLILK